MQLYNTIIVEDEPIAAEILSDYISQVPFLKNIAICSDALYAMEILQKEKVDLMFLDIHMPKIKGMEFIKMIKNPPQIIITSAYNEYALQGFELGVLDYLLKPIEFNRFLMAVNKLTHQNNMTSSNQPVFPNEKPSIFFNVNKKRIRVLLDDILFIEGLKEYVKIYTTNGKTIVTKTQLSHLENELGKSGFLRIHRSFIVPKNKIDAYSAADVEIQGRNIPIGRGYKELIQSLMEATNNR
ncbi:LytTR family DNA-binding domain-containing protein [Sediminibacterium sp. KACHI17]|uniref:LytTR family DNA-binding domain-containing protein n=1 Tax=Sediminibacterium sp. KACHI17 TaxID=1751071 RepID=A0AAT9GER7_9BACT